MSNVIVTEPVQREFSCGHCDGRITIPKDLPATSGPCPYCSETIISPEPETEIALQTPPTPVTTPHSILPEPAKTPVPDLAALLPSSVESSLLPVQPAQITRPVKKEELPKVQVKSREDHPKQNPTKNLALPQAAKPQRRRLIPAILVVLVLSLIGGGIANFTSRKLEKNVGYPSSETASRDSAAQEMNYNRLGWQKEAYQLLRGYMAANRAQEKAAFVLNGANLITQIEDFYGGGMITDTDIPADSFSAYELTEEDRRRGLFLMIYDQPSQIKIKEFPQPLTSSEVQNRVNEGDLLQSTSTSVENIARQPLRVHAFFKITPEGMKLDWEIFAQTKYRTLHNFVKLPKMGQSRIFRTLIVEDVPDLGRNVAGTRTYRLTDPANTTDIARVNVKIDSETGRALSLINWRDTEENLPINRTATVELKWAGEEASPELQISHLICWEFLGLGSKETDSVK